MDFKTQVRNYSEKFNFVNWKSQITEVQIFILQKKKGVGMLIFQQYNF